MTPPPNDRRGPPPPPPQRGGGVPSKLSDTRRGPPQPGAPRPPSGGPGPGSGRGPPRPPADDEHPATAGPQPPRAPSRGPAPASHGHKKPGPPGKPAPKDPAPAAFEIRRGRASAEAGDDGAEPLGPVVLPRSITQEAEEERLKERFGVDRLPEVQEVNSLVRMTESQGTLGPDRARRRFMLVGLIVVLILGGVVAVLLKQGLLKGLLGGP